MRPLFRAFPLGRINAFLRNPRVLDGLFILFWALMVGLVFASMRLI